MSFFLDKEIEIEKVELGITRKILSRSKNMMVVKVFLIRILKVKNILILMNKWFIFYQVVLNIISKMKVGY
ncbi:hypothetical protein AZH52_06055 [Proteus mirabilis]|nr:hypothetical protein AZH52_06055 [Proteus mirabilis]